MASVFHKLPSCLTNASLIILLAPPSFEPNYWRATQQRILSFVAVSIGSLQWSPGNNAKHILPLSRAKWSNEPIRNYWSYM